MLNPACGKHRPEHVRKKKEEETRENKGKRNALYASILTKKLNGGEAVRAAKQAVRHRERGRPETRRSHSGGRTRPSRPHGRGHPASKPKKKCQETTIFMTADDRRTAFRT